MQKSLKSSKMKNKRVKKSYSRKNVKKAKVQEKKGERCNEGLTPMQKENYDRAVLVYNKAKYDFYHSESIKVHNGWRVPELFVKLKDIRFSEHILKDYHISYLNDNLFSEDNEASCDTGPDPGVEVRTLKKDKDYEASRNNNINSSVVTRRSTKRMKNDQEKLENTNGFEKRSQKSNNFENVEISSKRRKRQAVSGGGGDGSGSGRVSGGDGGDSRALGDETTIESAKTTANQSQRRLRKYQKVRNDTRNDTKNDTKNDTRSDTKKHTKGKKKKPIKKELLLAQDLKCAECATLVTMSHFRLSSS